MAESMSDIFLELVNSSGSAIKGESQDNQFPGQIELNTFSLKGPAFSRNGKKKTTKKKAKKGDKDDDTDTEKAESPGTFSFTVTKDVDKATPVLVQTYSKNLGVQAESYSQAVIRCRLPHVETHLVFLALIFTEVHLTKYEVELDGETNIPKETLEFGFKALEVQYLPQTNTGNAASMQMMMTAAWPPPASSK